MRRFIVTGTVRHFYPSKNKDHESYPSFHIQKFTLVSVFLCLCVPARSAAPPSDFKVRAFYLDCRTQVMTVSAIKELASDLSKKEINTLLIEYEATFPFQKHATLCNQLAFSRSEVQDIVSYCTSLGIEVIPLQNCFGHCEYILRHDRYAHLREDSKEVSQVCPLKIEEAKRYSGKSSGKWQNCIRHLISI